MPLPEASSFGTPSMAKWFRTDLRMVVVISQTVWIHSAWPTYGRSKCILSSCKRALLNRAMPVLQIELFGARLSLWNLIVHASAELWLLTRPRGASLFRVGSDCWTRYIRAWQTFIIGWLLKSSTRILTRLHASSETIICDSRRTPVPGRHEIWNSASETIAFTVEGELLPSWSCGKGRACEGASTRDVGHGMFHADLRA
jgi:hypothetical protein